MKNSGIGSVKGAAPQSASNAVIEEQNDAEGGDHLIEMVAVVKMAEDQEFEQQSERQRGQQRQQQRRQEIADQPVERDGEIGARACTARRGRD